MSKTTRILAPAAAALALAAPVAQARPAVEAPNHNSPVQIAAPAQPSSDGFDWGSAAIGAGGVAGLLALVSAGAAAAWRVRVPSTR